MRVRAEGVGCRSMVGGRVVAVVVVVGWLSAAGVARASFVPAPGSPFASCCEPSSVALGDVNGDGRLDLAIANSFVNNVRVLLGDGSGGFAEAPGSPFGAGNRPESVAIGDVNGDGQPDLATANQGIDDDSGSEVPGDGVMVLLADGAGGFGPAPGAPFAAGEAPFSVAVADVNGDGKPDLAAASLSDVVAVLLGDGSGGFAPAPGSPFAAGDSPRSVAVGDVGRRVGRLRAGAWVAVRRRHRCPRGGGG